ncbi:MAG: excinuclease ABC subunit UvrA [Acidobacteriia bacterium]|nr:excinuclease ABC subunit UvrA [Terriglobia bacterium]
MQDYIVIRGARVHNLKNLSLRIPHNQLTVVTGVSGSGKSSLVFDTIYAEGQRRYVESLSAYARQFLDRMEKPAVDDIDGIAPPIAIRQKNTTRNPRSTVATATELYDYMRLLWARSGATFCPTCGNQVLRDSVDVVAARVLSQPAGSRWYLLFPVRLPAGHTLQRDHLFELRKNGFNRLFQNGRTFEFSTPESLLEIDFSLPLFILIDRLVINDSPELRQRIVDAVEIAYRQSGEALIESSTGEAKLTFNEKFACKTCNTEFVEPEPNLFSFNSPAGACPRCQGFGNIIDYDPGLIIPDPYLALSEGAVHPWTKPAYTRYYTSFARVARGKVRLDIPFSDLNPSETEIVWREIRESFTHIERKKYRVHVRVFLSRYRGYAPCTECAGARLRREALNIKLGGETIAQTARRNIAQALEFFEDLELSPEKAAIAGRILIEIRQRLNFLNDVGLDYLTLDRLSATLSGGEAQRITLATCLGSRLVGACYVLDEPSIGLHSRDTSRLIRILHELRDLGNTILVVEHDPDLMRAADHILDLGPGAGEGGGRIVFHGTKAELFDGNASTLTARYLRGELQTALPRLPRKLNPKRTLRFEGCRANNLRNIDVEIPLDMLVCVTGVSGSGKSTLVHEVIYKALGGSTAPAFSGLDDDGEEAAGHQHWRKVHGAHMVKEVILVDQSPIGRTPRSNPVTYIKVFDIIRDLFASTREAVRRGYGPGHFSFNIPGGRCESCQGGGTVTVEMQFLADVELICEECRGTRFKQSVLEIRHHGKNVHEVLQLTVNEAIAFFAGVPRLATRLQVLADVGLGYLRLGQSATTLSGGEAQRVKLASHLAQSKMKASLYIFDEPTTGLHFDDIAKLLDAFQRLITAGASLLIIEHNLEVIRHADWVIDLGPGGGSSGGLVVAKGTPAQLAQSSTHTGKFLAVGQASRPVTGS